MQKKESVKLAKIQQLARGKKLKKQFKSTLRRDTNKAQKAWKRKKKVVRSQTWLPPSTDKTKEIISIEKASMHAENLEKEGKKRHKDPLDPPAAKTEHTSMDGGQEKGNKGQSENIYKGTNTDKDRPGNKLLTIKA